MRNKEQKTKCVYVTFDGIKKYLYKCPFEDIEQGDEVEILISGHYGDEIKILPVQEIVYYTNENSPYPLELMKTVLRISKQYRGPKDLNSLETLKKIDNIKNLDKEIDEYCIQEYGYNLRKNYVMGNCFALWAAKKKILKEKYNIDWLTPAECNPDIIFD